MAQATRWITPFALNLSLDFGSLWGRLPPHQKVDDMYRTSIACIIVIALSACSAPTRYSWQDTYQPPRESVDADLETCKAYTARQYQPGTPTGAPYLEQYRGYPNGEDWGGKAHEMRPYEQGEWRPDRDPSQDINMNSLPIHDVEVGYTGYPGELDYHPGYLDAILEKCMLDRGWVYQATEETGWTEEKK